MLLRKKKYLLLNRKKKYQKLAVQKVGKKPKNL